MPMSVQMNIIKATKKEVPDIVFLNSYVQKVHVEKHPDIFKPVGKTDDLKKFFDIVLSKEDNCILVGYIDSTPVGYVWATFDLEPDNPFNYEIKRVHIHHMAVHEKFRRQHIGKLLFRELQSIAREKGIRDFTLDTWAFNKVALSFFNQLGFATYGVKMWRRDKLNT